MRTPRIAMIAALATTWLALPAHALMRPHPARAMQTTLNVTNDNREAIFVVLTDGATMYPLGTVEPRSSVSLAVPASATESPDLRIVATQFSNWKGIKSEPLTLAAGEQVDVKAETPAAHSSISVQ